MRIAVVMLGANRGGIEQAAVDYCEALRLSGHTPVAFLHPRSPMQSAIAALGVEVVPVRWPVVMNLRAGRKLSHQLAAFDTIFLHGNRASRLTRRLRPGPAVWAVAHSRFFRLEPHFTGIIALSETAAKALAQRTPLPITVIPNLVRLPEVTPRPSWRQPVVIGALGRFSHEKGFDLLLDAFALLRTRGVAAQLVIGGDGALAPALKAQATKLGIHDAVEWLGWVEDKAAFFASIDLFCLPSRTESFPITLMEAMGHGLPVIATDCGGPASMLGAHAEGMLCAIHAPALAEALVRALADPDATRTRAAQLQRYVADHFALPVVAAKLHALLTGNR
ncbi:MAG: glycosyltransferase [Rickettsiales bacterium]